MEQQLLDFQASAIELILTNRIIDYIGSSNEDSHKQQNKQADFGLLFNNKYGFKNRIPGEWSSSVYKLLVLEFFLKPKFIEGKNMEKDNHFLVEQWCFELNEPMDGKLKHTIDSNEALNLKLRVLLRSMSTLTVTLPLYRTFLQDKFSHLHQDFVLDYSIKFSSCLLSNWHTSVQEELLLCNFTNQDLVLPGRTFSFKVNYVKNLSFVQKEIRKEELPCLTPEIKSVQSFRKRARFFSEEIKPETIKNTTSKIHSKLTQSKLLKKSLRLNEGAFESSEFVQWNKRNSFEDIVSPINSIFGTTSPIETLKPPRFVLGIQTRRRSNDNFSRDSREGTRDTYSNQSTSDYEFHIVENDEDKITEVIIESDITVREDSPMLLKTCDKRYQELVEHAGSFVGCAKQMSLCKTTKNTNKIQAFMKKNGDDQVGEILKCLDKIKDIHMVTDNFCEEIQQSQYSKFNDPQMPKNENKEESIGYLEVHPAQTQKQSNLFCEEFENLDIFYQKLLI